MWIKTNPSHEVFRTSVADPELLIKGGGGEGGQSSILGANRGGGGFKRLFQPFDLNLVSR